MKFFIGIVPPPDIHKAILNIQQQYGNNRLEPHITLRPPVTLTDTESWINAIEQCLKSYKPFDVTLCKTGRFGTGVLFIGVISHVLSHLQKFITQSVQPFENDLNKEVRQDYHAHLTLGRKWCGFTEDHFKQMEVLTNNYLQQPLTFTIDFIRIYNKPTTNEGYKTYKDISISKP